MNIKRILARVGLCFMIAAQLMFYYLFMLAYINPTKMACYSINEVGEANIELVLNAIGILLLYFVIKNEAEHDD